MDDKPEDFCNCDTAAVHGDTACKKVMYSLNVPHGSVVVHQAATWQRAVAKAAMRAEWAKQAEVAAPPDVVEKPRAQRRK